ncbi:hypothetical protein SCAZ3_02590 [Streptococcus canis FSL Z3-227]|uniref:Uncharacterized protein n=1 Tax=Streptococcus canis FSL Z3-227 TaxID=482234 RepID=A0AAV3FQH2_STRCB|nr:hypothetical protein SCAZ3_02590 [Streptococcus canis FSL Z3-227]
MGDSQTSLDKTIVGIAKDQTVDFVFSLLFYFF